MNKIPANVKFIHCRDKDANGNIKTHGGLTIAYVLNNNFKVIGWAGAKCHPNDRFVKKIARAKAAGRLNSGQYYQECPERDEASFIEETHAGYKKLF